jgi:hypothetical protein
VLWVLFTQTIRAIFIAMNPICYSAYTFWDCVERRHVIALFLCCDDATQPAKVTVLSPKSNSLRLSNESKRCAVFAVFPVTVNVDQYVYVQRSSSSQIPSHTHIRIPGSLNVLDVFMRPRDGWMMGTYNKTNKKKNTLTVVVAEWH